MDFRLYDGALGRFFGIDLLADLFTSHSPYHFAYNNPVSFADPTGLSSEEGGHTDMDVIVINVNPPQLPPLPGIDTRPPYFGNFFQFPGIYDPNNPDWDTELPEMIIDKRDLGQEAKNTQMDEFVWGTGTAITIVQVGAERAKKEYAKEIFKSSSQKAVQSAKIARVATKAGAGLGFGIYTYANSEQKKSDKARLVVSGLITLSGFVPYVGPVLSIGFGLMDANGYFDDFYNGFD